MSGAQPSNQPAQAAPQTSAAHPNLAGTWALNVDQSDDPHEKMREAIENSGGQGEGGHGGWGGGGGGGGEGHGGGGGHRHGQGQGQRQDMMKELSQLTIEQTDTSAKVTGSSGRVLALYSAKPANPSANQPSSGASSAGDENNPPPSAAWDMDQLVVVADAFGGTRTQSFGLSPDGKQLYLITKVENERFSQPVTYRLVYDRVNAKPSGGASAGH